MLQPRRRGAPRAHLHVAGPYLSLGLGCFLGFPLGLVFPSPGAASPLFDLAGDTLGRGGLQAGSVPGSASAAYFNPALLLDVPSDLEAGVFVLHQEIGIELDGRPDTRFAVPSGIENAGRADFSRFDNYPIPTNDLQFGREADDLDPGFGARPRQAAGSGHDSQVYAAFGANLKLFEDRLALAIHGLVPLGEFTRLTAFFNDEREQYFSNSLHPELYGDRMTAPSLAFGAGLRLLEGLSLGLGATLGLKADVVAPTYVVDTGDLEQILIDLNAGVNVSLAPHAGVSYTTGDDRLRLTATAHAPRRVTLGTSFTFLLANGVEQASGVDFVLNHSPWQFGAGVAYDLLRDEHRTLTFAGTLAYAAWHTYVDRHGDRPGDAFPWDDTLSPSFGVRFFSGPFETLADISYTPTPVPLQRGRTNYVDNDRASGMLGGQYAFTLFGNQAHVGFQLQLHHLLRRHQSKIPTPTRPDGENLAPQLVKDEVPDDAQLSGEPLEGAEGLQTNNPGWPGFASAGWVIGSSVFLRVSL